MIFGQTMQPQPQFREAHDWSLRYPSVATLQSLLLAISHLVGRDGINPGRTDGVLNFKTAWALRNVVKHGIAQIPVVGKITKVLGLVPEGPAKIAYGASDAVRDEVNQLVLTSAVEIASILAPVKLRLQSGSAPAPSSGGSSYPSRFVVAHLGPVKAGGQIKYPPGTVAIRDPMIGKYRILYPTS